MINVIENPVLSICIPVYNRKIIFKSMLDQVCKAALISAKKIWRPIIPI
jgi:hypothetical protein